MWVDRQYEGIEHHPYFSRGGVSVSPNRATWQDNAFIWQHTETLPDWECVYCGTYNAGPLRRCLSCGAPMTKPKPPEPRYSPALQAAIFMTPPPKPPTWWESYRYRVRNRWRRVQYWWWNFWQRASNYDY